MKLPHFKKQFLAGALAAGMVMGAGGIAAAYFSASGTGSGHANVGTLSALTVTSFGASGTIFPSSTPGTGTPAAGGGGELAPNNGFVIFSVANASGHNQKVIADSASVVANGSTLIETALNATASVTGCHASWFTATPTTGTANTTPFIGLTLATGTTVLEGVVVHMPNRTFTQNACEGHFPKVTLTVKSANTT